MVEGRVIQFRQGRHTQKVRHFLIEVPGVDSREKADKFKGKDISWKSPGKEPKIIAGKIASAHGNKGVLRAIFERGLPGQAIGTKVEIKSEGAK
jgi:large subunit ribosomal protein L35Ae